MEGGQGGRDSDRVGGCGAAVVHEHREHALGMMNFSHLKVQQACDLMLMCGCTIVSFSSVSLPPPPSLPSLQHTHTPPPFTRSAVERYCELSAAMEDLSLELQVRRVGGCLGGNRLILFFAFVQGGSSDRPDH